MRLLDGSTTLVEQIVPLEAIDPQNFLIGVISSYLATTFLSPPKKDLKEKRDPQSLLKEEIHALRDEVRSVRALLEGMAAAGGQDPG